MKLKGFFMKSERNCALIFKFFFDFGLRFEEKFNKNLLREILVFVQIDKMKTIPY
jgi:hypothetical protein